MNRLMPSFGQLGRSPTSTRRILQVSFLVLAFLLPFLSWRQAAGCLVLALLFVLLIAPYADEDSGRETGGVSESTPGTGHLDSGIVLHLSSLLALVLVFRHSLHLVAAVWAIAALGDAAAGAVGETFGGPALPYNRQKSWSGFFAFALAGTAGAYVLASWVSPALPVDKVLWVSASAALVGAFVETLPIRLDDNVTVPLVCGGFMYCAFLVERSALDSNLPYLGIRILLAVGITLALALLGLALKMVTRSGAAVGFLLGVAVYLGYGYKSFLLLLLFFVLGSVATRLGYATKVARGVAERRGGARTWREALANGLAGAFFAILVITTHYEAAFLVALLAAFAEAAGDTVSSEIGQWLSDRAYLITTWRAVPAGTNGGVTMRGTVAGLAASCLVASGGLALGLCSARGAALATGAALAGNLLDSLLGATLEQRGLVTNGIVNFAGTSFAGALALAVFLH
jgi:uncharacterized protein (TIGR00297 family)